MIPLVKSYLPPPEILMPELQKVLYSGYIAQGELVENFERSFEQYLGGGHSLSLNSGTAALHIALILAGITKDDEVISTALTAEPTNVAIKMVGAKIRYADVDFNNGSICPQSIKSSITDKTKAIMVVDYAGIPVNIKEIKKISTDYNIPVIHDAAHSLGSKYEGAYIGNHFNYTAFSLQAIKHITTIDGGILQLLDKSEYEKGKLIRWFGLNKNLTRLDNNIQIQGYKYHMNNVNAVLGFVQMNYINEVVNKYVLNGKFFDKSLKDISGIELLKYNENSEPSYWLYTLKVDNRDGFIKKMAEHNIMASELHKRNDLHSYLNDFKQELPILDKFYSKMVHIPCGWWVTDEDREKIVTLIKQGW
jgi:perosamine synthetase